MCVCVCAHTLKHTDILLVFGELSQQKKIVSGYSIYSIKNKATYLCHSSQTSRDVPPCCYHHHHHHRRLNLVAFTSITIVQI